MWVRPWIMSVFGCVSFSPGSCPSPDMYLQLALVYVTLLLPVSILSLPECNFPAVFNFGDSNSDTGALVAMFRQAAARPPNGETFFGSPAGRVCDGRLLIDFIGTYSEYTLICCRFFIIIKGDGALENSIYHCE
ncbi:putative alpha-L-fucosidase [Helianthus annuus]|nr:putative alpha-L-fucosidase [Helianthus annuus]